MRGVDHLCVAIDDVVPSVGVYGVYITERQGKMTVFIKKQIMMWLKRPC
jgi:hypothetical protein